MNDHVSESIQSTIDSNDVVLFMKGSKEMPQCGFSNAVVNALSYLDVKFEDCCWRKGTKLLCYIYPFYI